MLGLRKLYGFQIEVDLSRCPALSQRVAAAANRPLSWHKSLVGEGAFTDDPYGMDGGIAVIEVKRLRRLLKVVTQHGFEHHVAMVRGHWGEVVGEAVGRYLDLPLYLHNSEPLPTFDYR